MASDYRVLAGWDVALGLLNVIKPQPTTVGVRPTDRVYLGDGSVFEQGLYVELRWNLLGSGAHYRSVLTYFNLHLYQNSPVTLYCRDDLFVYNRYNGVAIRPESNWGQYFPRDVVVLVRNLVKL